jgi:hypothetical protein
MNDSNEVMLEHLARILLMRPEDEHDVILDHAHETLCATAPQTGHDNALRNRDVFETAVLKRLVKLAERRGHA